MSYDITVGRDKSDKERFGKSALGYIGKGFIKMGQYDSLSNRIFLDVARSHVILVAGKRGCLTGETLVFTDRGYIPIKEFDEQKNKVLSFNKEKEMFEWEKAKLLEYPTDNEELIKVEFEGGKELNLTSEHPLLKHSNNSFIWEKACNLREGDEIAKTDNQKNISRISIKNMSSLEGIKKVYDLTVDKNHSFIANGVISHNSGKSYSLGVLAEEITNLPKEVSQNIAPLIFDTMGIYWTMKFQNEKDKNLLEDWDLKPKNLPVKVYVPFGHYDMYRKRNIPVDEKFALAPWELEAEEWVTTFGLKLTNPISVLIVRILNRLKEKGRFTIKDIISEINKDKKTNNETKNAAEGLFESALDWGIFATDINEATQVEDLVSGGKSTVLDLSVYSSIGSFNVRALTISLVARKLFNERIYARKQEEIEDVSKGLNAFSLAEKKEHPLVWMFIDEAHEFLPLEGKTVATDALVQLLREGRQPGISMVLATQQPGKIHRDVMTQSDIVLSHRVTAQPDVEALNFIMQSYLYKGIKKQMDDLPRMKGSAIILDDNSERIYPIRIRPRFTWHGGEAPTAIHGKKD